MAEEHIAGQYFEHLVEYSLAICRECRYGVLPSQIQGHLQHTHRVGRKKAELVQEEVDGWSLVQYASEVDVPSEVIPPICQLPVYPDGLLCTVDSTICRRVFRSTETMRKHWQKAHNWSVAGKGGRPSRLGKRAIRARVQHAFRSIHCQRLFVQGQGSQYFEVQEPAQGQEDGPEVVPVDGKAAWARLGEEMDKTWANVEKLAQTTIQAGERNEVNPWLERTGWLPYLVGLERPNLLASIEEPNVDPEKDEEPIEAAIWEAMDGLARFSQRSVIDRIGVFVRLEAIRTEKHQTRFQPLQPYMDEQSIGRHVRSWQQILMFFARTQKPHEWRSPKYRLTRRQREAWDALVEQTGQRADEEEMSEEEMDENMVDEVVSDAFGGNSELDEEEQGNQDNHRQPVTLTRIQKACLQFCIELLNQSITRKEYDSPLVCALAV